jgi:hypothetical protein
MWPLARSPHCGSTSLAPFSRSIAQGYEIAALFRDGGEGSSASRPSWRVEPFRQSSKRKTLHASSPAAASRPTPRPPRAAAPSQRGRSIVSPRPSFETLISRLFRDGNAPSRPPSVTSYCEGTAGCCTPPKWIPGLPKRLLIMMADPPSSAISNENPPRKMRSYRAANAAGC